MKKCLSLIVALAALLPVSSSAQMLGEVKVANICNHDDSATLNYAVMDVSWSGKIIAGWEQIPANQCRDVWRFSGERYEHHFVFFGKGQFLDASWGRGWDGDAFCVDPKNGFEIRENMFNQGRGTSCQGTEVLRQANVRAIAGTVAYLELPPWSGASSGNVGSNQQTSGSDKEDESEGGILSQICGAFVCLDDLLR